MRITNGIFEKNIFLKHTNKSVDHKFKSLATNWPRISI